MAHGSRRGHRLTVRVLLVNDLPPGPGSGVEVYIARLIAGLEAAGDTVDVVGGEIVHRGVVKLLDLWDPRARRLVRERAGAFGADVVHHHNVIRELSVAVLGVPSGIPNVLTVHDHRILGRRPENRGLREVVDRHVKVPLDRAVARRAVDLVVAVSEPMSDELRAAGFDRVVHVPHPTDDPIAPPLAVTACRDVVFAGRLSPEKGAHVLVPAFRAIADRHPGVRLVIVGEGPQRAQLEHLAGNDDRVVLTGRLSREDLSRWLGRARVVAVPSLWTEAGPMIAIEAARHGRPIVASEVAGLRELVSRLGAALTVPTDRVEPLAEALDRLLSDDDLARRLSANGERASAEHHTIEAVTERMRAAYRELIGG